MESSKVNNFVIETIAKYFPEIKKGEVKIHYIYKSDFYMAMSWWITHYVLVIDKSTLKFSESAFKGCLAHELSHIIDFKKSNIITRFKKAFASTENTEEERAADLEVINRGLGKELLQFHEEHNKLYKSYKETEGLTKREIKRILKPR